MSSRLFAIALLCCVLFAMACGGNSDGDDQDDSLTGMPEVDAVIDAVLGLDTTSLVASVSMRQFACTDDEGAIGSPVCEAGEAPGTMIDALPLAQCRTHFTRAHELRQAFQFNETIELYAVYRADDVVAAVFSESPEPDTARFGVTVGMQDGKITYIDHGCGQTAEQLVQNVDEADFVVAPVDEAEPTP